MKKAIFTIVLFSLLVVQSSPNQSVYADPLVVKITNASDITTLGLTQAVPQIITPIHPTPDDITAPAVREPIIVEVQKGDSLIKLAETHSTTYQRLFNANPEIIYPDVINSGDKIKIPYEDEELPSRPLPEVPKPVTQFSVKSATPLTKNPTTSSPKPSTAPAVAGGSVWDRLAQCESGGNWFINTSNGYYGGLQFTLSTWQAVGGSGYPHQNSREEQIARAEILLARSGWGQWPACTLKLGLR
ncbi:transglycosylase family protein [Candidatus Saccharibacteria bacterium]|nr:transglycosylase family protein [Candidatus Saccharibacteria bacterium]